MIRFDPHFTIAEVARAAELLDAKLMQDRKGNIVIVPRDRSPEPERHTNSNVVPMQRRKGRINPSYLTPTGPEVA